MFDTLCELVPRDSDYPDRVRQLSILHRLLDGTLYDVLPHHFHEERGPGGENIPLRQRRPSVRYPLCRIVVEDSVSLLFSEGHFPSIDSTDPAIRDAFASIIKETRLNFTMTEAAMKGSVGSVALLLRVLQGRIFVDVLDTMYLRATWDPRAPDTLARVDERYKVSGADLLRNGYQVDDPEAQYWFARSWDSADEIWFEPLPVGSQSAALVDAGRTVSHRLGVVPIIWIKNLPGLSGTGDPCDGACTFAAGVHMSTIRLFDGPVITEIDVLPASASGLLYGGREAEAGSDGSAAPLSRFIGLVVVPGSRVAERPPFACAPASGGCR